VARHYYPTLIIIEDIDFIGTSRDFAQDPSLGELLNQLDGNDPNFGIFVIATTNRPEMLDNALANRPSRFDVLIEFKLPDKDSCKNLIKLFSKNMVFDKELNLENLALSMKDLTGAQIKESIIYAKLVAIHNSKEIVAIEDVLKRAASYKPKNNAEAYRQ
jgi:ATP-dependent 26S proteasome regulatory subunit